MALPKDLVLLILTYLPFKQLQTFNQQIVLSIPALNILLYNKYNIDYNIFNNKTIFTPFELYSYFAANSGDIGYLAQFYLPPYVCILYALRSNDLELIQYYLYRFLPKSYQVNINLLGLNYNQTTTFSNIVYVFIDQYVSNINKQKLLSYEPLQDLRNIGSRRRTNYNFAVTSTKIRDIVTTINPDKLTSAMIKPGVDFPAINFTLQNQMLNSSVGLISTDLVRRAKLMITKVLAIYKQPSINRDLYLNYLSILTNNDIDLTNVPNDVVLDYAIVALSVANSKVLTKIENSHTFDRRQIYSLLSAFIPSEVLYDIKHIINYTKFRDYDFYIALFMSAYLSNQFLLLDHPIKSAPSLDTLGKIENKIPVIIVDAETAIRLGTIVDVNPYLQPLTQLSYNLMIDANLKPKTSLNK